MQIFRDKNGLWNTIEYLLWTFDLEQYPGLNWRSDYNAYPLSASTLFIKSVGHILLISRSAHGARWPWVRNGYTLTPTKLVKERGMDVGWCYTDSTCISAQQGSAFYSYSDLSSKKRAGLNAPPISAMKMEHNDGWPKSGWSMKMRKRQRAQIPANKQPKF